MTAAERRVLEEIRARPGMNWNHVMRRYNKQIPGLRYHLLRMEGAGLIVSLPGVHGKETLFFAPEDKHLWADLHTRILFGVGVSRRIALYIAAHPGATSEEMGKALGMEVVAIQHHLRKLKKGRLILAGTKDRHNAVQYFPLRVLQQWAQTVGVKYEDEDVEAD